MTQFNKSDFNYGGGYLTYKGDYEDRPVYANEEGVHPSRVGRGIDLFIARFKYVGSPVKMCAFKKFLIDNFTVEEYVEMRSGDGFDSSPFRVIQRKGFEY
tara:strand:- start:598 stop:897 length:300 start_codon:yes stop_codon:yes gene_type:complete